MKRARSAAVSRSVGRWLVVRLALLALGLGTAHVAVLMGTTASAPVLVPEASGAKGTLAQGPERHWGKSWVRLHGGIWQGLLEGSAEEIGQAQARLFYPEMVENETALWTVFDQLIPSLPLRTLVLDLARLRFMSLEKGLGYARRAELSAASQAFVPDPFSDLMPTYQRLVFLNSLYDISLSFEHSPLIGCSSVVFSGAASEGGHTLLGRNFDFETHEVFDRQKAVLMFREQGKIPVVSVAWAGLTGVVTGLNAKGVAIVVHGARARHPQTQGESVLVTVREALAQASSTDQAVQWIAQRSPLISHLLLITDGSGKTVVMERAPGEPAFVRPIGERGALSNHMEGPLAKDPSNLRVLEHTSTRARRERLDELVGQVKAPATALDVLGILRDRKGAGNRELALGDRKAIDALIATHAVVIDATERKLWVSRGPHLLGPFVLFDVARWADEGVDPEPAQMFAADPLLESYRPTQAQPAR